MRAIPGRLRDAWCGGAIQIDSTFLTFTGAVRCGVCQRVIDVLKVDVESAEWPFLRNVVNEDQDELNAVRQLLIEIHSPRFRRRRLSKQDLVEMLFYAKQLIARGFAVFRRRVGNVCCGRFAGMMPRGIAEKCCQESFYVNRRFLAHWRALLRALIPRSSYRTQQPSVNIRCQNNRRLAWHFGKRCLVQRRI